MTADTRRRRPPVRPGAAQLQRFLELGTDPFFVLDAQTLAVTMVNPAGDAIAASGAPPLGRPLPDLAVDGDCERMRAELRRCVATGEGLEFDARMQAGEGGSAPCIRWRACADAEQALIYVHGARLRDPRVEGPCAADRAQLALESAGIGLLDWDLGDDRVVWNEACFDILGLPRGRAALTPEALFERVHAGDEPRVRASFRRAIEAGEPCNDTFRVLRPDATLRWVRASARVFRRPGGGPGRLIGTLFDVTAIKVVEQTARDREQWMRLVQDAAGIASFEWDLQADAKVSSSNLATLYGRDAPVACLDDVVETVLAADRARVQAALEAVRAGRADGFELEFRVALADGGIRWLSSRGRLQGDTRDGRRRVLGVVRDVTAERNARTATEDSERRLRMAQRAARFAVWECDLVAGTETLTGDCASLFGTDAPIRRGGDVLALVHAQDRDAVARRVQDAIARGEPGYEVEFRVPWPDGQVRWLAARGAIHRGPGGIAERVVGIVFDVTERREQDQRLRASEERYRGLFQASPDAICLLDADTLEVVDMNDAFCRTYGRERDQVLGRTPAEFAVDAAVATSRLRGTQPYRRRAWHRRGDGSVFPVDVAASPLSYGGRHYRVVFNRDVSDVVRAERGLRESEEMYRGLFEASVDAIAVIDADDFRILDVNSAWGRVYGCRREDAVGHDLLKFSAEPQVSRQALAGDVPFSRLGLHRRADGRTFPVEVAVARYSVGGRPVLVSVNRDLTERLHAEQRLRESEDRYRHLFESSHDAVMVIDPQTLRIVDFNEAVCRTYGYGRAELGGRDLRDLAADPQAGDASLLPQTPELARRLHRRRDGSVFPVEMVVSSYRQGGRQAIAAIVRDVSERERAQARLLDTVSALRATLEATADGIVVVDLQRRITAHNRKYQDIWGVPDAIMAQGEARAALARSLQNLHDPDTYRALVEQLYGEPTANAAMTLHFVDGRVVEASTQPQVREGVPIGRVWSFRDISARVEFERRLKMTQTALDRALDAVFFLRPDGRLLYVNEAMCRQLGYAEDELLRLRVTDFDAALDAAQVRRSWEQISREGRLSFESVYRRRDGSEFPVEIAAHWLSFDGTEFSCVFARDITERRQAQDRLRRAGAELALAEERERKELARGLHDHVVQDLALIKIRLGTLAPAAGTPAREPYEEIRALVDKAVHDARSLLFEISPPVLYELGLTPALEWLAERFTGETGIECDIHCHGLAVELPQALQVLLFQVVRELLSNVRKHAQARQVSVDCRFTAEALRIEVRDDGVGFDADALARASAAAGFGLFSVRDRLELAGGGLDLVSSAGAGTVATVHVPLQAGRAGARRHRG